MATSKKSSKKTKAVIKPKTTIKSKAAIKHKSFKLSKEPAPFMTFRFTEQTFYWVILLAMILALALWVYNIQLKTTDILDSITILNR